MAKDSKLEVQLFYLIEKTHKTVRRYSQEVFYQKGFDITIDQWLVLKKISDTDQITQNELADALFKDKASITRILDLLLDKKLISKASGADKRIYQLALTTAGKEFVRKIFPLVKELRAKGMEGVTEKEVGQLKSILEKITSNMT